MPSLNFKNKIEVEKILDGSVKDPYKTLPFIFNMQTDEELEVISWKKAPAYKTAGLQ